MEEQLPWWRGLPQYDAALRGLQNAIAIEDEDGIELMHLTLSQLHEKSSTFRQDYKEVTSLKIAS